MFLCFWQTLIKFYFLLQTLVTFTIKSINFETQLTYYTQIIKWDQLRFDSLFAYLQLYQLDISIKVFQFGLESEQWLTPAFDNDHEWFEVFTSVSFDQVIEFEFRALLRYFFCRALEFWNQTWVTLFESPVKEAILSRSWPSGFESI